MARLDHFTNIFHIVSPTFSFHLKLGQLSTRLSPEKRQYSGNPNHRLFWYSGYGAQTNRQNVCYSDNDLNNRQNVSAIQISIWKPENFGCILLRIRHLKVNDLKTRTLKVRYSNAFGIQMSGDWIPTVTVFEFFSQAEASDIWSGGKRCWSTSKERQCDSNRKYWKRQWWIANLSTKDLWSKCDWKCSSQHSR